MEKKRVLHIAEAMGGGVFTYLVELANGMCEDFDITVAFGIRSETPPNYEEYFDRRVTLIKVRNFTRGLNPVKDMRACLELKQIVKRINPHIIHMHSSKAGAIGRMMLSKQNRKLFYTPHGYSFLMEDISPIGKHFYRQIEKICGKRNCMTVACGESEWEESKKVTKKSTFISNGINIEKIQEAMEKSGSNAHIHTHTQGNHPFTVYTVGRIDYQKNPELFNEIAESLPEIKFVWIGDGEMKDKLTAENITVTGWLNNEEAIIKAEKYDVFLLASRWEGLPIALLEAMYMKKPCIVSNVVGNRDVIENNYSGYICNHLDEFVQVIGKLAKDGGEDTVINHAYRQVVSHFNSGWLIEKYGELYHEVG